MTRRGFLKSVFALALLLVGTLGHGALVEKYVSALAAGGGTGAIDSPLTYAEFKSQAVAGWFGWMKDDGTYTDTGVDFAASGTVAEPIVLEGYAITPGDGYLGRVNGCGVLITTNCANISGYVSIAKSNIELRNITVTGSRNWSAVLPISTSTRVIGCRVEQQLSSVNCYCVNNSSVAGLIYLINCDLYAGGADSGGVVSAHSLYMSDCHVFSLASTAGKFMVNPAWVCQIIRSTLHPSAGNGISIGTTSAVITGCTIYGQAGDAIQTASTASVSYWSVITDTMITDCGRAINHRQATNQILIIRCRNRANTSTDLSVPATAYNRCLIGTGGPETDYVDAANGDLRLIQTSPAYGAALGGGNIGAAQNRYGGTGGYSRGRITNR